MFHISAQYVNAHRKVHFNVIYLNRSTKNKQLLKLTGLNI